MTAIATATAGGVAPLRRLDAPRRRRRTRLLGQGPARVATAADAESPHEAGSPRQVRGGLEAADAVRRPDARRAVVAGRAIAHRRRAVPVRAARDVVQRGSIAVRDRRR